MLVSFPGLPQFFSVLRLALTDAEEQHGLLSQCHCKPKDRKNG